MTAGILAMTHSPNYLPFLAILLYFVPAMLGSKTKRRTAIFVANLVFGWTVIGWLIVLVWAIAERETAAPTTTP